MAAGCGNAEMDLPEIQPSFFGTQIKAAELMEFLKEASQKGPLKLRSTGSCMYPCIKNGDLLEIRRKKASEFLVGQIAAVKKSGIIIAHRVIEKGSLGGRDYIVTRPDNENLTCDGVSFDADILGGVSLSDGKPVADSRNFPYRRFLYRCRIAACSIKKKSFAVFLVPFQSLQGTKIYRFLAASLFSNWLKRISFIIKVPLDMKIESGFSQDFSRQELISWLSKVGNNEMAEWSLVACKGGRFLGGIRLVKKPDACPRRGWWMAQINVRIRYQGLEIEKELLKNASSVLAGLKTERLSSMLAISDRRFKTLKRIGFEEDLNFKNRTGNKKILTFSINN